MNTYKHITKNGDRLGGVLLHPTSLPSGKLDVEAFNWIDFMCHAGLRVWQILPLGVPQQSGSPYQCYSAFAMNPELLAESDYANPDFEQSDYKKWCEQEQYWLHDYALYMTLKNEFEQKSWCDWPEEYKFRHVNALQQFREAHSEQILAIHWQQFCLYRRWNEIKQYANERNILMFGDMPIFVAHDSVDVWVHPHSFLLENDCQPKVVAGVPPDYFSETGQRWGNPHYDWNFMLENEFSWWLNRLRNHLAVFDLVRIDHFRGLESAWIIPASCETAIDGEWEKVPGDKLLQHLQDDLGDIALVAEDLGIITPEVNALREKFHLPGMAVLQFSFDGVGDNPHKPENVTYDRIVYTGTHDNDTSRGWFNSQDEGTQAYILETLGINDSVYLNDAMMDMAFNSAGQMAIIPMQDLLDLDSDSRMNIPGTTENNWNWKFQWHDVPEDLAMKTSQKLEKAGRLRYLDSDLELKTGTH